MLYNNYLKGKRNKLNIGVGFKEKHFLHTEPYKHYLQLTRRKELMN